MEIWQRDYITANMVKLIENTVCTPELLAELESKRVLGKSDKDKLESKLEKLEKASILYDIIQTRTNGYFLLLQALKKCRQTGGADILFDGVLQHGVLELKVFTSNTITSIKNIILQRYHTELKAQIANLLYDEIYLELLMKAQNEKHALKLINNTIPKPLPYYIPRSLSNRVQISTEAFRLNCADVFIFKNIDQLQLSEYAKPTAMSGSQLVEITSRYIVLEHQKDWNEICSISKVPVHLITYEHRKHTFVIECSSGSNTAIRKYLQFNLHDKVYITENEFLEFSLEDKNIFSTVCICDTPGMGKSMLLANIARQLSRKQSENIHIFVSLPEFIQYIQKSNEEVLDALLTFAYSNKLMEILQSFMINIGRSKLVLFFDGFDEIPCEHIDASIRFLQSVRTHSSVSNIFVTSRPHLRTELEKSLGVVTYDILPFTQKDQVRFLVQFWNSQNVQGDKSKQKSFAKHIVSHISEQLDKSARDIMGIPLQCYLFAETYQREAKIFSEPGRNVNFGAVLPNSSTSLYEMYKQFMETKFPVSTNENVPVLQNIRQMKSYHVWKALELLFPKISEHYAWYCQIDAATTNSKLFSYGILQEEHNKKDSKEVTFVHRTFAEFLVAELWMQSLKELSNKDPENMIFKLSEHFFEEMFSNRCKHEETVWFTLPNIIPSKTEPKCKFLLHSFKYPTVTYFINAWLAENQTTPSNPLVLNFFNDYNSVRYFRLLQCCLVHNYKNLLKFLLNLLEQIEHYTKSDYKTTSRLLCSCWLKPRRHKIRLKISYLLVYLSTLYSDAQTIEFCFQHYHNRFNHNINEDFEDIPKWMYTVVHCAIDRANYGAIEFLVDHFSQLEGRNLLRFLVEGTERDCKQDISARVKIWKLLIHKHPRLKQEVTDPNKPLILVPDIHVELLLCIIQNEADICVTTPKEETIMHKASSYLSSRHFQKLLEFILHHQDAPKIFRIGNCFHHILKHTRQLKYETFTSILSQTNFSIDQRDEEGNTLLLAAAQGDGRLKIMKMLVNLGFDIHAKNVKGQNVSHYATRYQNMQSLNYWISLGVNVNEPDIDGITPMLATYSYLHIRPLLEAGANLFVTDKNGDTVFHRLRFDLGETDLEEDYFKNVEGEFLSDTDEDNSDTSEWSQESKKYNVQEEICDIVDFVISDPATVNIFQTENLFKQTPLHALLIRNSFSRKLLEFFIRVTKTDVNNLDVNGNNLFLTSVMRGQSLKVLKCLIEHGSKVNARDKNGNTALHMAHNFGVSLNTLKFLVESGLPVNVANFNGVTPAMCMYRSHEKLRYLLESGANLFSQDINGNTIAHFVATYCYSSTEFENFVQYIVNDCKAPELFLVANKSRETPLCLRLISRAYPISDWIFQVLYEIHYNDACKGNTSEHKSSYSCWKCFKKYKMRHDITSHLRSCHMVF